MQYAYIFCQQMKMANITSHHYILLGWHHLHHESMIHIPYVQLASVGPKGPSAKLNYKKSNMPIDLGNIFIYIYYIHANKYKFDFRLPFWTVQMHTHSWTGKQRDRGGCAHFRLHFRYAIFNIYTQSINI